jgi:hypothetical protein
MTSVHCIAHRLHLAGQDAAREYHILKNMKIYASGYMDILAGLTKECKI